MRHWFLATNVLIDFLLERPPFTRAAASLLELSRRQQVLLYVASLSFSIAYYLVRKTRSHDQTISLLTQLQQYLQVAAVDAATVRQALSSDFPDFEDALQHFAAASVPAIEAIVTHDPKGFRASSLPIFTPVEALEKLV